MKKTGVLFVILLLVLPGCKKGEIAVSTSQASLLQEKIMLFMKARLAASNKTQSLRISDIQAKADFVHLRVEAFGDEAIAVTVPLTDINVHDFVSFAGSYKKPTTNSITNTHSEKNEITKVFFIMKRGEILDGTVVAISSDTYSPSELDRDFITIIQSKLPGFTGNINVNSLDKRPYNNWGYRNGRVETSTVLKRGQSKNGENSVTVSQTCTDWYWVTTYHYLDGSQTQTSEYIGTTCLGDEENFPPNEERGMPLDSICAQSKRLAADAGFINAMTDLKNRITDPVENGYVQKKNLLGNYAYTFKPGTSSGASPAGSVGPIDGFFHTHITGLAQTFSLFDIQQMYEELVLPGHVANLQTFTLGVVLPNQQIQLLRISDPAAFIAFGNANLLSANFGSFANRVAQFFNVASTYDQFAHAMLKSLQGSGLTLYEGNANAINQGFARMEIVNNPLIEVARIKCNN